ncbi:hypothetical protein MMC25_002297 [Agyrium rufum]|nr:hypothetical protein [Agyrium rufum]
MVLGLITAIAACPAIIGTTEAVRHGQNNSARERHRGQKSNLIVSCLSRSSRAAEIKGRPIVLHGNKLYIDTFADDELEFSGICGHLFAGYFLPYPESDWGRKGEGLVSTISDDPPQLNWIYVDKDTNEVKYGTRIESRGHLVGPWNCTKLEKRMTFDGWEGFMAVQEKVGVWSLYFDVDDDGLKDKVIEMKKLEIELSRKERRNAKADVGT